MTTITSFSQPALPFRFAAIVAALVFAVLTLPVFAHAAEYVFVNQSGYVQMIVADSSNSAIFTASNLSMHSGVMLIDSQADRDIIGDRVSGI